MSLLNTVREVVWSAKKADERKSAELHRNLLRALFAVSSGNIPSIFLPTQSSPLQDEASFLDSNDISKGRFLCENSIPFPHQLRVLMQKSLEKSANVAVNNSPPSPTFLTPAAPVFPQTADQAFGIPSSPSHQLRQTPIPDDSLTSQCQPSYSPLRPRSKSRSLSPLTAYDKPLTDPNPLNDVSGDHSLSKSPRRSALASASSPPITPLKSRSPYSSLTQLAKLSTDEDQISPTKSPNCQTAESCVVIPPSPTLAPSTVLGKRLREPDLITLEQNAGLFSGKRLSVDNRSIKTDKSTLDSYDVDICPPAATSPGNIPSFPFTVASPSVLQENFVLASKCTVKVELQQTDQKPDEVSTVDSILTQEDPNSIKSDNAVGNAPTADVELQASQDSNCSNGKVSTMDIPPERTQQVDVMPVAMTMSEKSPQFANWCINTDELRRATFSNRAQGCFVSDEKLGWEIYFWQRPDWLKILPKTGVTCYEEAEVKMEGSKITSSKNGIARKSKRQKNRLRPKVRLVREADARCQKVESNCWEGRVNEKTMGRHFLNDYFKPLFTFQFQQGVRGESLRSLMARASKTITTSNYVAMDREILDYRILKRVYQLQSANRWSLRQLKQQKEPTMEMCHLDHFLEESKWMWTDFREERKWKISAARLLAQSCRKWVTSSEQERLKLQVLRKVKSEINSMCTTDMSTLKTMPQNRQEKLWMLLDESLFDVVRRMPSFEQCLYQSIQHSANRREDNSRVCPVSKMVTTKIVPVRGTVERGSLLGSRYDYEDLGSDIVTMERNEDQELLPECSDVALFDKEYRGMRERLRNCHAFRPPSEFPMPSLGFYENRTASLWLMEEDQKLRALVLKYCYNWSLVSCELSMRSSFNSSAERRSPWECFERWIQLEGLSSEMAKMQYFRTYLARIEAGAKLAMAKQEVGEQNGGNGHLDSEKNSTVGGGANNGLNLNIVIPRSKKFVLPMRVERRRHERYLAMIDAMRKLAKKREAATQKQELHKAAVLKRVGESYRPRNHGTYTPQELSRIKWEREIKAAEKISQQSTRTNSRMPLNVSSTATSPSISLTAGTAPAPVLASSTSLTMSTPTPTTIPHLSTPITTAVSSTTLPVSTASLTSNPTTDLNAPFQPSSASPASVPASTSLPVAANLPIHPPGRVDISGNSPSIHSPVINLNSTMPPPQSSSIIISNDQTNQKSLSNVTILQNDHVHVADTGRVIHSQQNISSSTIPTSTTTIGSNFTRHPPSVCSSLGTTAVRVAQRQQQHQRPLQQPQQLATHQQRCPIRSTNFVLPGDLATAHLSPGPPGQTTLVNASTKFNSTLPPTPTSTTISMASQVPNSSSSEPAHQHLNQKTQHANALSMHLISHLMTHILTLNPQLTPEQAHQLARDRFLAAAAAAQPHNQSLQQNQQQHTQHNHPVLTSLPTATDFSRTHLTPLLPFPVSANAVPLLRTPQPQSQSLTPQIQSQSQSQPQLQTQLQPQQITSTITIPSPTPSCTPSPFSTSHSIDATPITMSVLATPSINQGPSSQTSFQRSATTSTSIETTENSIHINPPPLRPS